MAASVLRAFLGGMVTMGYVVAGFFFIRFWRQASDQLFLAFAIAFWLMGANQAVVILVGDIPESHGTTYLLRLAAFVMILIAIVRKNWGGDQRDR